MDIEELKKEREYLQSVVDEAAKRLVTAPDGAITRACSNGNIQYCVRFGKKLKYLSKRNEKELITNLMQKRQDLKIIRHIPDQIKVIDSFLAKYNPQLLDRFIEPEVKTEEKIDKSVSDASSETVKMAADTDLARNLIAICEAFLQSKSC